MQNLKDNAFFRDSIKRNSPCGCCSQLSDDFGYWRLCIKTRILWGNSRTQLDRRNSAAVRKCLKRDLKGVSLLYPKTIDTASKRTSRVAKNNSSFGDSFRSKNSFVMCERGLLWNFGKPYRQSFMYQWLKNVGLESGNTASMLLMRLPCDKEYNSL